MNTRFSRAPRGGGWSRPAHPQETLWVFVAHLCLGWGTEKEEETEEGGRMSPKQFCFILKRSFVKWHP